MAATVKSPWKWAGGKSRLAQYIAAAFGKKCEGTFRSPFLGGGALELYVLSSGMAQTAQLSDGNRKLINAWTQVRDNIDALMQELKSLPIVGFEAHYDSLKKEFNDMVTAEQFNVRQAALMIWLNHACYNGLYRENKSGVFNSPVGKYQYVALPHESDLRMISYCVQNTEFLWGDFGKILKQAQSGDHIYCDPPYVPLSATANFKEYGPLWLGDADHYRLSALAVDAANVGAKGVITNHKTGDTVTKIYPSPPFVHVSTHPVARMVSCKANRQFVEEMIVSVGPLK